MAIAFDASSTSSVSSTSLTWSHTCTGSDRILFVCCAAGTTAITGVTYSGVSMTLINTKSTGADDTKLFYLIAPATGANNIIISRSGSGYIVGQAMSYTGAKQTGQPDASGIAGGTTTTSFSQSLTSVADGCWAVMSGIASTASALTAGSNTVVRYLDVTYVGQFALDSGTLKTPAGTTTLAVTSASQTFYSVMATFAPVPASGNSNFLAFF